MQQWLFIYPSCSSLATEWAGMCCSGQWLHPKFGDNCGWQRMAKAKRVKINKKPNKTKTRFNYQWHPWHGNWCVLPLFSTCKRKERIKVWKGDEIGRWGDLQSWGSSIQLPGCSGPVGIAQVLWASSSHRWVFTTLGWRFSPSCQWVFISLGSGSFWDWARGLWGVFFFGGLHLSLCLAHSLTPLLLLHCPDEEN